MPRRPSRHQTASDKIQKVADKYAPYFKRDFLDHVAALRRQITSGMVEHAASGNSNQILHQIGEVFNLKKATAPPISAGFQNSYAGILSDLVDELQPNFTALLNITSPQVINWALTQSSTLITNINSQTMSAIRNIVSQGTRGHLDRPTVEFLIKNTIGLDTPRSTALANYAKGLYDSAHFGTEDWAPHPNPDPLIEDYADRLLSQRAETIARTETMRASNEGQQETWRQAVDLGYIDPTTFQQEWMVTDDDRLCPECEPMDGIRAGLDGNFEGADGPPPLHPNCRCTVVAVDELDTQTEPTQPDSYPHVESADDWQDNRDTVPVTPDF